MVFVTENGEELFPLLKRVGNVAFQVLYKLAGVPQVARFFEAFKQMGCVRHTDPDLPFFFVQFFACTAQQLPAVVGLFIQYFLNGIVVKIEDFS